MKKPAVVREAMVAVTDMNLRKSAMRLLGQRLVSPEIFYVQNELGGKATQSAIDDAVRAVRKMPWAKIVVPE